jgi:hypothetical protein
MGSVLSWWTWTWWETIVVALLASIAFNTLFSGTEEDVNLKGEFYDRTLLLQLILPLAAMAGFFGFLFGGIPALLK